MSHATARRIRRSRFGANPLFATLPEKHEAARKRPLGWGAQVAAKRRAKRLASLNDRMIRRGLNRRHADDERGRNVVVRT